MSSAESAEPAAGSGRTAHSGMAELIVSGSLFGIGEHIVRLGRLLELLLGLLIPRILVRVILDSRLSVSFLYLIRVGVLRHAKHFVVISLFCHSIRMPDFDSGSIFFFNSRIFTLYARHNSARRSNSAPVKRKRPLLSDDHFRKTQHLVAHLVTGLYHIDDLALLLLPGIETGNRLVVIGIQLQSERLDLLHILFLERFPELLCDQFHTLTKRLQVIALLDRFQRPLQIVHQRQKILHALGASALHQLHLLPQRALAEMEREGLMFTNRTSGRYVTEDREMIGKVREQIAGERITEFLSGMSQLGFTEQDIVALLEKRSGEEKNNG